MRTVSRALSGVVAAGVLLSAAPAFASHFRASTGSVSYDAATTTLTWVVDSGWRSGRGSTFLSVTVTDSNGAGVSTPVTTDPPVSDTTNPLFDHTTEEAHIDISSILGTPGTYMGYASSCCRIGGIVNSGQSSFSQMITFTVTATGSVDLPPAFNSPTIYTLIPVGGTPELSLDYTATDPEAAATTYTLVTNTSSPDYGATAMACSDLTNGIFRLSSALCTNGDVFSTIYTVGSYFAVKVRATDATGNSSETDTLLRVPVIPLPSVNSSQGVAGGTQFDLSLTNRDTMADSYSLTCTNSTDPTDVKTGTSTTPSIVIAGLSGTAGYDCVPTATNGLGTGTGSTYHINAQQMITFAQPADTAISAGTVTVAPTSSSSLPVTLVSNDTAVCTVSGFTIALVTQGVCSITASAAGDATYDAAGDVTRTFNVTATPVVVPVIPVAPTPTPTPAPVTPIPTPVLPKPGTNAPTGIVLTTPATTVPVTCTLTINTTIASCVVNLYATVGGTQVLVGSGSTTVAKNGTVVVQVTLNGRGTALAGAVGGANFTSTVTITATSGKSFTTRGHTHIVAASVKTQKAVFFANNSSVLTVADRKYLDGLRLTLAGVRSVECAGFTDARNSNVANDALGMARAKSACSYLLKGTKIKSVLHTFGETRPQATNSTMSGRALNRRAEITFHY